MVSIITTVKNGSRYILETLESINNQTFKGFEHIIVDDGSTDNTVAILEEFKTSHPHYDLSVFTPGHLGRGKALNFAVAKAKYPWIAIIDADDIWHPKKLEAQTQLLEKDKSICVLATKTGLFTDKVAFEDYNAFTATEIRVKELLYVNKISHSSVIIDKNFAMYDETRTSQLDYELWLRLGFGQKKKLSIIDNTLSYHRIHEHQSFESKGGLNYIIKGYKLMASYAIKYVLLVPLAINSLKLVVKLVLPRSFKMRLKNDK